VFPDGDKVKNWDGGAISTDFLTSTDAAGTAFVHIYNNQVVASVAVGITIWVGKYCEADHNRVVSAGVAPDGRSYTFYGYGIGCLNGNPPGTNWDQTNSVHDNVSGFMDPSTLSRNDYLLQVGQFSNNQSLPAGSIQQSQDNSRN
jgi:hypothetical protein